MVHASELSEPWEAQRRGHGWFVLLIGVVVFALFGAVVGYAYLRGLPGIGGEPPLIRAAEGPYREAPADPGGLPVPNANSHIVNILRPQSEPPRVERLLPAEGTMPLESPEPGSDEDAPVAVLTRPDGTAAAPAGTPLAPEDEAGAVAPGLPFPRTRPSRPEPLAEARPAEPTIGALPQIEPAAAPPATPPAPEATSRIEQPAPPAPPPAPVAQPQPQPRVAPPAAAPPAGSTGPQRLVRATPPAPPAAVQPATVQPAAGGSVYRLQLAAVRSEGGLTQAWADLRQRFPAALSSVNPQVERTDTTSGPLFRLQAGPFRTREAAADACGAIRGSGGQCFIVGPITQ